MACPVLEMVNWGIKGEVLAAVARNGYALRQASAELKTDREVVLAAVAMWQASAELQADRWRRTAGPLCSRRIG